MGYTHHIKTTKATISMGAFKKIKADIRVIENYLAKNRIDDEDLTLFDSGGGKTGVDYKDGYIGFNGDASKGEESEAFCIDLEEFDEWNCTFCKTNRRPYDIAVCMALISIKLHSAKGVSIITEGDDEDWVDGFSLYKTIFPKVEHNVTLKKIGNENYLVR